MTRDYSMHDAAAAKPTMTPVSWVAQAVRFTLIETATYLRDKAAIFWTFIYPVALLILMMSLFGNAGSQGDFSITVDVEGDGQVATQFLDLLDERFSAVEGVKFVARRVESNEATPDGRVRVILPPRIEAETDRPSPIVARLNGSPDASSGSMLSLLAETSSAWNLDLANAPERVAVEYDIRAGDIERPQSSTIYYVIGLAVLTLVSTALFGFSGPLIELRARGGLKLFQFMPVSRSAFLVGFATCRVIILVGFCLIFMVGGLAYFGDLSVVAGADWSALVVLTVLGAASFLAVGLALAGIVTSNSIATALINIINLPIMFLSDLFIPVNQMPELVQQAAKMTPVYQLANDMRSVASGAQGLADCSGSIAGLAAMGGIALLVASFSFRWRLAR